MVKKLGYIWGRFVGNGCNFLNFYPWIEPSGPYLTIWCKKQIYNAYSFWDLLYGAFDPRKKEENFKHFSPAPCNILGSEILLAHGLSGALSARKIFVHPTSLMGEIWGLKIFSLFFHNPHLSDFPNLSQTASPRPPLQKEKSRRIASHCLIVIVVEG